MMHYVVVYDISNDKMRLKTARILEDFGDRVQHSVFECPDLDDKMWTLCWNRLQKRITLEDGDSIRAYALCESCRARIRVWSLDGGGAMENPDVIIL